MSKRPGEWASPHYSRSQKQRKTLPPETSSHPIISTLENEIFKVLRARSVEHAADVTYWTRQFHPILKRDMHVSSADIARVLLRDPMSVSTFELSQIIRLRPCTSETPAQTGVKCVYYIRTFALRKPQLEAILATWETANKRFDVMPYWVHRIAVEEKDRIFYVRYVGMAEGGKIVWDRFEEDLKQSHSGILAEFLREVVNAFPEVFDACQCHELLDASYPDFHAPDQAAMDERKKVVISLFDRNVLLNQQGSGLSPSYIPRAFDRELFVSIGTKYFNTYGKMIGNADQIETVGTRRFVSKWGNALVKYAQENPIETLTNRFPITDEYLESVIQKQAIPGLVRGASLIALVGKDVALEDLTGHNTFLSGSSHPGRLTVDMLARVHQYENRFGQPMTRPFFEGQFPFVDVFPWIGHRNVEVAIEFVRQYLEGTRPRIVVTFSKLVSTWTASSFVHPWGLPSYFSQIVRYANWKGTLFRTSRHPTHCLL